jgi:hypothetical protein
MIGVQDSKTLPKVGENYFKVEPGEFLGNTRKFFTLPG